MTAYANPEYVKAWRLAMREGWAAVRASRPAIRALNPAQREVYRLYRRKRFPIADALNAARSTPS